MAQKIITAIQQGIVQGNPPLVGWVLQYADGRTESFALHVGVARQFLEGMQTLVARLEAEQDRPRGTVDGLGMHETVSIKLVGG